MKAKQVAVTCLLGEQAKLGKAEGAGLQAVLSSPEAHGSVQASCEAAEGLTLQPSPNWLPAATTSQAELLKAGK